MLPAQGEVQILDHGQLSKPLAKARSPLLRARESDDVPRSHAWENEMPLLSRHLSEAGENA